MLTLTTKHFNELTTLELYQILKLRSEVFVVEQNCPYLDLDDKDLVCYHVMGYEADKLVATTRLVPIGVSYKNEPAIGRVVTHSLVRNKGYGKQIMQYSITQTKKYFNSEIILIGAQCYLDSFYRSLGFIPIGNQYLEDNIPHITMKLG